MKKIAIIGANEFQNPLILKAKQMGFQTHVFAWQCGDIGEKTADIFYPISITEKEKILDVCRKISVQAIASIGSDLAIHTVNYVSRAMGFPCNPESVDINATNKFHMRRAFEKAELPTPGFVMMENNFSAEMLEGLTFPLIVKPVDRSGSRGITKVESLQQAKDAVKKAQSLSFCQSAIIEEFIYGEEYSCESISYKGNHHILAFTKKYTTGAPHYIETGHVEPSDIPLEMQPSISKTVCKALDALGIQFGASHTEFRLQKDGSIRIIEIGSRMGGDCIGSDLVELSTGYDFVKMVIDVACGKNPEFTKTRVPRRAEIHFIFNEKDFDELKKVKKETPKRIWRMSDIKQEDQRIVDSSTRRGYYILFNEE